MTNLNAAPFHVTNGQFWLNDQPLFINAGEFHYFRTPPDQWEHRLGLLRAAGFNAVAAYMPWLWHQPQPDLSDLDGHSHPARNLAGFLDLAASMGLHIIARPGPYIMAETINEGIPPWVFSQHPQAAFVAQDGSVQNVASYLHPRFLACVEAWYREVFAVLAPRQVTRSGSILMVQLDNEMGMIQWVRNIIDTNSDTLTRFAQYLRETYGDTLAARYGTADPDAFLPEGITHPQPPYASTLVEDYRRFYRHYLRDYMAFLYERAAAHGMEVAPIVNIHGFGNGGKTFPIGLSQLVEAMEISGMISATDVYPMYIGEGNVHQLLLVNEMTKALQNPQQPLFSIEFQAGGNQDFSGAQSSLYDLHSRLCISCGMRAINHYLFFDGENDPLLSPVKRHNWGHPVRKDGTLRAHYARYPKLSHTLAAYGTALVQARPKTTTTIGFLLDQYMTEVNNEFTRPAAEILTHQRDTLLFDLLARGLALTHRPFDALELTRAPLDVESTPLLWVMLERQCDAAVQQKLADYVRQGGRLVIVGRLPTETFDHAPCTLLQEALGIHILHADPPFSPASITAFNHTDVPVSFMETYSGDFDEVFAASASGEPVGVVRRIGSGEVMLLGAALAANTFEDLDIFDQMANRMGCLPMFSLSEWADVRLSEGEQGSFLFVSNYQDDPLEITLARQGTPLFGGHAVRLAARSGAILPLEWQVRQGVTLHYLTAEVTEVLLEGERLLIRTAQPEFDAELSLAGWQPDASLVGERIGSERFRLRGHGGVIEMTAS